MQMHCLASAFRLKIVFISMNGDIRPIFSFYYCSLANLLEVNDSEIVNEQCQRCILQCIQIRIFIGLKQRFVNLIAFS